MPLDYNKTVNLPQTDFPMRAALPKREPDMLQRIYDIDLYHKMIEKNEGKPLFSLHDGPPFSNGYIHMGTAMNKCIKDFIVRYKNMSGFYAPYVPGWDNHGMPIESAIIKQNKLDRKSMSIPEFRNACRDFAWNFVNVQRDQFKRLGVLGEWDDPYLTMKPGFEAEEVRLFGKMYEKGYIYRGKKPVYWCCHDETALAEAEIEYGDDACDSLYVKFALTDDLGKLGGAEGIYFVIWTTTPWTIPGNLAISLNADVDYVLAKAPNGETYIIAKALAEAVAKAAEIDKFEIIREEKGSFFELMKAVHPLYGRESIILNGDHVTTEAGTGCVHTAPGHGMEDYEVCRRYDASGKTSIGIIVPVDDRGHMTEESGPYEGMYYAKANKAILDDLRDCGALLASEALTHQYPHCWRCKKPVIYRATDQWFCSVDAFKEDAVRACNEVQWLPDWGYDRMTSMIRERADWCISRQRQWGLPIPILFCDSCREPVCTPETIESVAKIFEEHGSNAWFDRNPDELVPDGFSCPYCGGTHFFRENNTLDCWFDSGSTHVASMERDQGFWPSTMYLEGADQFRGWFQSSLLTSVATRGRAPYSIVLTHGWTVDGEGKAMHKSLGNGIFPEEIIPKYGADLLRLWAASSDYRVDMRCSDNIFKQLSDMYLKIRNTARYILGNLAGFDPNGRVAFDEMLPLDKWAMTKLGTLIARCRTAYDNYEFHTVTHALHHFCVVEMSNFYLDILKDRLYCDARDSHERRSAQSAIYNILDAIVRLIAPILAFTSDEIWQSMPHHEGANAEHVILNDMPEADPAWAFDSASEEYWRLSLLLRDDVNKALELARAEKVIGKPLEAKITLYVSDEAAEKMKLLEGQDMPALFIVSEVELKYAAGEGYKAEGIPGLCVAVSASEAPKCSRCWTHTHSVGENPEHPEICARCAAAVQRITGGGPQE